MHRLHPDSREWCRDSNSVLSLALIFVALLPRESASESDSALIGMCSTPCRDGIYNWTLLSIETSDESVCLFCWMIHRALKYPTFDDDALEPDILLQRNEMESMISNAHSLGTIVSNAPLQLFSMKHKINIICQFILLILSLLHLHSVSLSVLQASTRANALSLNIHLTHFAICVISMNTLISFCKLLAHTRNTLERVNFSSLASLLIAVKHSSSASLSPLYRLYFTFANLSPVLFCTCSLVAAKIMHTLLNTL